MGQTASSPQLGTTIQVIGAGLPRTGTSSFSAALSILLSGPVYHGGTQMTMGPSSHIKAWIQILRSWLLNTPSSIAHSQSLLTTELAGYVAVTDLPATQFVPELLSLYLEALVICTTHDPET
ncbi:hypothetical protein BJX99DRAFT_227035 [Aspergillus californicus]